MYCIYDKIAKLGAPPFVAVNDNVALRQFQNLMRENPLVNSDDYLLFKFGSYDDSKPLFVAYDEPIIVDAASLLDFSKEHQEDMMVQLKRMQNMSTRRQK